MNAEQTVLIRIIKQLLHRNSTDSAAPADISFAGVDFDQLFTEAKKNSVANMAAYYICGRNDVPQEIRKKFEEQRLLIVMQQMKIDSAVAEMTEILDELQAPGLLLKGSVIKELYPDPYMRSMSDVDVYAEEEDIERVGEVMREHGFTTGMIGKNNHYEYSKYEVAKIEFHPELVARDESYGELVFSKLFGKGAAIAQALDVWNHCEAISKGGFLRKLTLEHHYIYIVMHMMNHFLKAGTGIRSLTDIWVLNHHYALSWDRKKIDELLAKFGLDRFERYALALADKWFDLPEVRSLTKETDEELLEEYENDILASGTYGTLGNSTLMKLNNRGSAGSKIGYLVKSFFRPYGQMKKMYPILEKAPVLLPALWIHRGIYTVKNRKNAITSVINADKKAADKRNRLVSSLTD